MYVILAYDVSKNRTSKVMKICRKYLSHVQKSVFEGTIKAEKLDSLKAELQNAIDFDNDGICLYQFDTVQQLTKEQIGVVEVHPHII